MILKSPPAKFALFFIILDGMSDNNNENDDKTDGIEKGEKIGIEKGENNKAIEVAKKMLRKGMDVDDIADISGLSVEEIKKLSDAFHK